MDHEKISQSICFMESDLSAARYHIETGKAINWAPDELRFAILWAMDACLMVYGYEEEGSKGFNNVLMSFVKYIPPEVRSQMVKCYCNAVFLDSSEGDLKSWKNLATECLEETEKEIFRTKAVIENKMMNNSED